MSLDLTSLDDSQLVTAIRNGDSASFQALYNRYATLIYRFLWKRTGQRETAEDLTQECFFRLWHGRDKLNPDLSIKAWCYQVASNLAVDHLRKKVNASESVELDEWFAGVEPNEVRFQIKKHVHKAIADLPPAQGKVFWLCRYEGFSYNEVGQMLNISTKTVENHMNRALKKLRHHLKDWATHVVQLILF